MLVRNSQRGVQTIHEDEEEAFDEEFSDSGHFDAGVAPTRKESFSLMPSPDDETLSLESRDTSVTAPLSDDLSSQFNNDDDTVIGDVPDDSHYEAAPPSATTPPVHRSVDMLPTMFSSNQPSNIVMDEVSVYTEVTEHSMATIPINNRNAINDDATVITTSTMATAQVGNTSIHRVLGARTYDHPPPSSTSGDERDLRRPSNSRPGLRQPAAMAQPMMNDQGHTMSEEEMQMVWRTAGKCVLCGNVETHKKVKYGPFGTLRRMAPQTIEGYSYKGYCLRCHDVPQLRQLLNEPDIPMNLLRTDPLHSSLLSMQSLDAMVELPMNKKSPIEVLCASAKFQLFCGAILLAIAGSVVAVGISMAKRPEPWVSQPPSPAPSSAPTTSFPTTSPTSYEWNLNSVIKTDIESFGHHIKLSSDGSVLAVSSPSFEGSKGRFDVYVLEELLDKMNWKHIDVVAGTEHIGANGDDFMGLGMHLSGDGLTVAVGSPGHGNGLVQAYQIDKTGLKLTTKGQAIVGPAALSEFGHSVALNFNGTRLFVGAPVYGLSTSEVYGLVRAYDFDSTTDSWIQVGSDMASDNSGSRFGHSISASKSGNRVAVGAPLDSSKWEHAGEIQFFELTKGIWTMFANNQINGADPGAQLGTTVVTNRDGMVVITNDKDKQVEKYSNAGVTEVWAVDADYYDVNIIGFPLPGTHENARFGRDLDITDSGEIIIASGDNNSENAGSVRVFLFEMGRYNVFGHELMGPKIGNCQWLGKGPSVTVAAEQYRMAIGYECILSNGVSRAEVQVFDYFAVNDYGNK